MKSNSKKREREPKTKPVISRVNMNSEGGGGNPPPANPKLPRQPRKPR